MQFSKRRSLINPAWTTLNGLSWIHLSVPHERTKEQLNSFISEPFYEPAVRIPTKEEETPDPVLVHSSYGKEKPGPYVLGDLLHQLDDYYQKQHPFYKQDPVLKIKRVAPQCLLQREQFSNCRQTSNTKVTKSHQTCF
jgi:hypothetical protein